jgi:hypothetical protein
MAWVQRSIAQCDVCGYEWIPRSGGDRCGNGKCKSRKWNAGDSGSRPASKSSQSGSIPDSGAKLTGHAACDPEYAANPSKPSIQALRDICEGIITREEYPRQMVTPEIVTDMPRCKHKEFCEDGECYGCRLAAGHKGKCVRGERID